jgi:hypothetical protein
MRLLSIGPAGDLVLGVERDAVVAIGADGAERWRAATPELVDAALVGEQVWAVSGEGAAVERFDLRGQPLAPVPVPFALGTGRFLTSPLSASAAWNGRRCCALRADGAIAVPEVEVVAPTLDGRWLLWRGGFAALWRSVGEAWRRGFDDAAATLVSVSTLTDGRMIALCFRRRADDDLRLVVLGSRDGDVLASMRLTAVTRLCIAARRAVALVQVGDQLDLIDLRFGRALRQLHVDPAIEQLLVDETLQHVATTRRDRPGVRLQTLAEFEREAEEAAQRAEATVGAGPERSDGGSDEGDRGERPAERSAVRPLDRKSTRLNSSHNPASRMPSSA